MPVLLMIYAMLHTHFDVIAMLVTGVAFVDGVLDIRDHLRHWRR